MTNFKRLLAILFSIPIYILGGSVAILMIMIESGIQGVKRIYDLWYDTFVEA